MDLHNTPMVEDAPAGLQGGILVAIWTWAPRTINIDDRVVGEVRRQQELIRSGVDQE